MLSKWVDLDGRWGVVVYYDVQPENAEWVCGQLARIGCSEADLARVSVLFDRPNKACTLSDFDTRMSIVCIGWTDSREEAINSIIHEIDHVQRDVCKYYGVHLGSEESAYLQGELGEEMMII